MGGGRLVVAGGGIAGVLAAAAGAAAYDEVLIVEAGSGAAQGKRPSARHGQLHNVLGRGQRQLEELLPGFGDRLFTLGGVSGSVTNETHVYEFGGFAVERPLGLAVWSGSWRMLWDAARSLLPDSVDLRFGHHVVGLQVLDGVVRGVELDDGTATTTMQTDAVVDATGFASRFPQLLASAGWTPPAVESHKIDRWFVTYEFVRPSKWVGSNEFWMVFDDPPDRHVALLSPLSEDRWVLSVSSEANLEPPLNLAAVYEFLDMLPGASLRPIISEASQIGGPHLYRRRDAAWRHYEQVEPPVQGFVPIGDAFAAMNPVYGQGVSIAAWEASILRTAWQTEGAAWTDQYLSDVSAIIGQCWMLNQVPVPLISPPQWGQVASRLASDENLQRKYIGIWHLLESPMVLPGMCTDLPAHDA